MPNIVNAAPCNGGFGNLARGYLRLISLKISTGELMFKEPYTILFKNDGNQYSAQDASLSLFVFGKTLNELQENIIAEFAFMWDFIATENSADLSEDAMMIKNWLTENLIPVKAAGPCLR